MQRKRTCGSREEKLLLQFWRSCLTGPSGPFAFSSQLLLEKLMRCLIVFMKLLELWVITKFEVDLETAQGMEKQVKMSALDY